MWQPHIRKSSLVTSRQFPPICFACKFVLFWSFESGFNALVDAHLGDDLYLDCPLPQTAHKHHQQQTYHTIFLVTKTGFDNCILDETTNLKALITCQPNSTTSKTYKTHITNYLPFGDFITYFVGRDYYFLSKLATAQLLLATWSSRPISFLFFFFVHWQALPISFQQINYPIGGACNASNSRVLLRVKPKHEAKSKPMYGLLADSIQQTQRIVATQTTRRTTTPKDEILLLESDYYTDDDVHVGHSNKDNTRPLLAASVSGTTHHFLSFGLLVFVALCEPITVIF
jgi:hypothetical protein